MALLKAILTQVLYVTMAARIYGLQKDGYIAGFSFRRGLSLNTASVLIQDPSGLLRDFWYIFFPTCARLCACVGLWQVLHSNWSTDSINFRQLRVFAVRMTRLFLDIGVVDSVWHIGTVFGLRQSHLYVCVLIARARVCVPWYNWIFRILRDASSFSKWPVCSHTRTHTLWKLSSLRLRLTDNATIFARRLNLNAKQHRLKFHI